MQKISVKEILRILSEEGLLKSDSSIKVLYESIPSNYLYYPSRYSNKEGVKRIGNLEILEEGNPVVVSIFYKSYDEISEDMPKIRLPFMPYLRAIEVVANLNNEYLLSLSLEKLDKKENSWLYVLTRNYDFAKIPNELEKKIEKFKLRLLKI
jgi:hypothetical protein